MIRVTREVATTPDRVWAVLADGWSYALWVVGASHIRDVDAGWPAVGTRIHHSVGAWPLLLEDTSEVLEATPERHLLIKARGWPAGTAHIALSLQPSGAGTKVTMEEQAHSGPGALTPVALQWVVLKPRNTESLERLATIAERRGVESPR